MAIRLTRNFKLNLMKIINLDKNLMKIINLDKNLVKIYGINSIEHLWSHHK